MRAKGPLLDPIYPGETVQEDFLRPMGISINRLSPDSGVPPERISAIVNGKRAITVDTALRLGIGLFHSKTIVEAHHGRLEAESEEGKGSTFRVMLPWNGGMSQE
jgi:addiction module HigA family antidote